jgi:hypothetical protein
MISVCIDPRNLNNKNYQYFFHLFDGRVPGGGGQTLF